MTQNNLLTLSDLTPEIEARIPGYIKKYTSGTYDGGRYDNFSEEKAHALINWNYDQCDYKFPVMLVAENPYEAQIYFNMIAKNEEYYLPVIYLLYCLQNDMEVDWIIENEDLSDKLDDKLDDKLYGKLRDKLRDKLDDKLRDKLYDKLRDKLDDKLDDKLYGKLRDKLDDKLRDKLYDKLYGKLRDKLDDKLRDKLYDKLDDKLDGKLYGKLRDKLRDKLDGKLDDKLYDKLYDKLRDKLDGIELTRYEDYLFTANIWSNVYAGYYKFIKDEFKIEIEEGIMLDSWNDLYLESGVYSAIFSELLCIVSKYPKKIHIDANDELHNISGQAIEWGYETVDTKFECYYIHGREIQKEVFEKAAILKQSDFISETNDEIRSAWFEILGNEKIMKLLEASLIDSIQIVHKNGEIETIEYYRTKDNLNKFKNEPYAWRKVICPSTGTTYLTPTDPTLKTALDVAKFHRPEWVPKEVDYSYYSRS